MYTRTEYLERNGFFPEIARMVLLPNGPRYCCVIDRFKIAKYSLNLKDIKPKDAESPTPPDYYIEVPEDIFEVLKSKPAFSRKKDYSDYVSGSATKSVTLDCDAIGYPEANITWYRTTKLSNGIPEPNYKKEGWKLTIEDLALEDKGNYTCIVANELGSINWNFTVEVLQRLPIAPIVAALENQTAVVGEDVMWTCQIVLSDSQPMLQWLQHYQVNNSWTNEKGQPHVKLLQRNGFFPEIARMVLLLNGPRYCCVIDRFKIAKYSLNLKDIKPKDAESPTPPDYYIEVPEDIFEDLKNEPGKVEDQPYDPTDAARGTLTFITVIPLFTRRAAKEDWSHAAHDQPDGHQVFAIAPQMLRATCAQPPVSVSSFPSSPFGLRTAPLKKMGATPLTISQMGIIAYADQPDDKFSYESKLLEKVIRMEIKMSQLEQVLVQTGNKFENLLMNVTVTLENKTAELDVLKGFPPPGFYRHLWAGSISGSGGQQGQRNGKYDNTCDIINENGFFQGMIDLFEVVKHCAKKRGLYIAVDI
ncbi:FGFR3-like protein [Mya arenaria]|uniref:FGFR3-like protein n=1 Tax=Mya arenaria TaxID=6604 RepID=A0ABY7FIF9_MYAAR|nr:FGFR3-like protein [Mya arenaria]